MFMGRGLGGGEGLRRRLCDFDLSRVVIGLYNIEEGVGVGVGVR